MAHPTNFNIHHQIQTLADAMVSLQYELQPEIWKPYGSPGRLKSVRDTRYHLEYLIEALDANSPELFIAYLSWVKILFAGLGFPDSVLPKTLECMRRVLAGHLPQELLLPILDILEKGRLSLDAAPSSIPSYISGDTSIDLMANRYLDLLLSGDRLTASRLILEAVDRGTSLQDIYLQVFQRAQRDIGRLWQTNQISVAQEHYCTAATQLIMSQLYPRIFASEKKGFSMVATCVGGELHEIGARMVADFFEMHGWDTYFLGANMPTASILDMLSKRRAALLAISATMTFHVPLVRELVAETRKSGLKVRIMVGGYPFNIAPRLWESIGADGYAPDARLAVSLAEKLVA
jgi:methanogenic corrinoid protein MtbC1